MSTIAIDESVHRRLSHLKQDWGASSMNDVVERLLDNAQRLPKSMFGSAPRLPPLDRKTRNQM